MSVEWVLRDDPLSHCGAEELLGNPHPSADGILRQPFIAFQEDSESIPVPRRDFVDNEKCVGCEECVDVCPSDVFEMKDEKSVPVNKEECIGCESCVEVCESEAITVTEVED